MANKMLIDANHPEETRVVVLRGNRVEEFDFESAQRKQLRGNIYLAKVTRVEPSLQAAFVDYGGNRHGFLAFSEIHPDYYQIPVADRQALIDEEERAHRAQDDEEDRHARGGHHRSRVASRRDATVRSAETNGADEATEAPASETAGAEDSALPVEAPAEDSVAPYEASPSPETTRPDDESPEAHPEVETLPTAESVPGDAPLQPDDPGDPAHAPGAASTGEAWHVSLETAVTEHPSDSDEAGNAPPDSERGENVVEVNGNGEEVIESVGGESDAMEEMPERTYRPRRQYKIQEVIKRRQVMLVQVVKEERGTKGAALTTYLSLAGRYSVLMPNTARGGGISRKITDAQDRRRLKEIAQDLDVPEGMGVILRTAGAARTKTEIKRDFEYLLRLWETVRDLTLKSTAPTLVYEEGSLVKRSIRDLYNKDIDEVVVGGDEAYKEAKDFMRMLMPSHAKNVKPYRDGQPLFTRHGIESQLDAMFSPIVQLKSGGYIVINQTEALVAIDVNSGRATREHHIEDTAVKTNVEAADEIARQLRLRDLAGLIVIDFIDMDEKRNNRTVERRLKDALKHDRARIQVGHISHFGLMEMSRQRIRSSVLESSTEKCPHCGGSGHVRSVSSVALQLLRAIEETLLKGATHNLIVRTRTDIAIYVLNHKRAHLRDLETRFQVALAINADESVAGQVSYVVDKGEQVHSLDQARALAAVQPNTVVPDEEEAEDIEDVAEAEDVEAENGDEENETAEAAGEAHGEGRAGGRRRRRRRGRRGEARPHGGAERSEGAAEESEEEAAEFEPHEALAEGTEDRGSNGDGNRRRRRGRRGGRRNRREGDNGHFDHAEERGSEARAAGESVSPEAPPAVADEAPRVGVEQPDIAPAHEEHAAEAPTPAPGPAREPSEAAPPAEPAPQPRRRSTVREPVPMPGAAPVLVSPPPAAQAESLPKPEPVPPATPEPSNSNQPRRMGWWSRKVLGKG